VSIKLTVSYESAQSYRQYPCSQTSFAAFHRAMLSRGVMLPPSQLECWFVSLAHDDGVIDLVVRAAHDSLKEIVG